MTPCTAPPHAPRDGWQNSSPGPFEVICHGDFAVYNCVLRGDRVVGIIDFDHAHPGSRLWDFAYAAYTWVPLTRTGDKGEQAARLRVFADRYGLDAGSRARLADAVIDRLHALVAFMREQASAGHPAFSRHVAEGHDRHYLADVAYVRENRDVFTAR